MYGQCSRKPKDINTTKGGNPMNLKSLVAYLIMLVIFLIVLLAIAFGGQIISAIWSSLDRILCFLAGSAFMAIACFFGNRKPKN